MTKVYIGLSSDILDREITDDIISVEYSNNIMDSNLAFNTGVCEQYINIEFKDSNKFFRNLALNNSLEYYDTFIFVYLLYDDNREMHDATFEVYDWDIDMCRDTIKINGRDPSYQFNDISVSTTQLRNTNVYTLIQELFNYVNYEYQFNEDVMNYCQNIYLPNNFYTNNTLYELLNKVCELALLRIYWYQEKFMIDRVIV